MDNTENMNNTENPLNSNEYPLDSLDDIYFNCVLMKKIIIEAKYLNENLNEHIEYYLKKKVEGKCINEGYVKEDSLKILKRSIGKLNGSRFAGDITFEIAYTVNLCNPVIGNILDCKVKFINKLGLLGNNGPLEIIISKEFHQNEDSLNKISINDMIKVQVIGKKFSLNDKEIIVIAKLWNSETNILNLDLDINKSVKKDMTSSDLTPIFQDNDFIDNEFIENLSENDNELYSVDDNEIEEQNDNDEIYSEEDDIISLNDDEEIQIENPDKENIEEYVSDEEEDNYDDELE